MRGVMHETFGDPAEVLQAGDAPYPAPGKGELLVRTILSPIHNHDIWTVWGQYGYKPELPVIGGSEAVGVVEAVGGGADESLVGKRIAASGIRGAWAETFTVRADTAVPLPDAIPDEQAAQLVAMPFSAIALLEMLGVEKGDWIVQSAANGAVGKVLAVLARARGVETLNLVRRKEAAAELEEIGIGNVVSTAEDGWKDKAKAILGKAGARAAVDSVGGTLGADLADLLGQEGLLVTFGTATGAPLELNSGTIIFKQLTVKGFWASKVGASMPAEKRVRLIGELVGLAAKGELPLPAGGTYGFADIGDAIKAAQTPGRGGKILLKP